MRQSRSTTGLASAFALLVGCASGPRAALPASSPVTLTADEVRTMVTSADARCQLLVSRGERDAGHADAVRAHQAAPRDRSAGLALASCAQLRADFETDEAKVLAITEQGAEAARLASSGPADGEAAYLQAINLGLYVQVKGLTAIGRLSELVSLLKTSSAQPEIDQGGPLRVLGLLYVRAPAWPVGPGDLDAGLDLLKQAAAKYPEHPLNHLFYAQALIEADDHAAARRELDQARALCVAARYGDWATRWKKEAEELAAKLH
ncbi:MAG TPA: tetratricopeptide repeat protein [Polyangia bacterium]|nr:tetratricopeptide repeat protein [Polyangia bacterium]